MAGALAPAYEMREQARAALGAALHGPEAYVGVAEGVIRMAQDSRDQINAATGGLTDAMARAASGGDLVARMVEASRVDVANKALGRGALDAAVDPRAGTQ